MKKNKAKKSSKAKKNTTALAKKTTPLDGIVVAQQRAVDGMNAAIKNVAHYLTMPLTPITRGLVNDALKDWGANLEELQKLVRGQIVADILAHGANVPDSKQKELIADGYRLRMKPWRSTTDPAKYTAMFTAKKMELTIAADQTISYKPNEAKLDQMVAEGVLTKEERDSLRYDLTWSVDKVKKLVDGGNEEGEN